MKKFLIHNIIFLSLLFVPFVIGLVIFKEFIPAPRISNSYSFNEKMKFVANRQVENPEILAIGSSITFNNLNSDVITNSFNTESYINMSSWGMRMEDVYALLEPSIDLFNPRIVVIASSAVDFNGRNIVYNIDDISDYLNRGNMWSYQYATFNPKYFFKRMVTNYMYYNSVNTYKSLSFDEHGAVLLSDTDLQKIKSRWEQEVVFDYMVPTSYEYLDSIAGFLAEKKVELVFVQSPVRANIRTHTYVKNISQHIHRVNEILDHHDQTFINCTQMPLDDYYFADSQHLNVAGAGEFTKYWVDEYLNEKEKNQLVSER